ncbi:hypothetical protein [Streptomyces flaveolus]|uniref:hypothetical protein n=1 Tax=Streptomyces flaveolus TaxID=67297 RepID=UPI003803F11E
MPQDHAESPYATLPDDGRPHDVAVGHALITMVEPHVGHERAYNRWYEDDHFFSGALFEPWLFAGRRWVATHDLQQLRYPKDSTGVADPITKGCYLGTYWITPGRLGDHKQWTFAVNRRLSAEDRINRDRDHVFTSFQDKAATVYRDQDVPNEVFSLMDPAPGLVLEVVDAPTAAARDELERWLAQEHLPSRVTPGGPVSSAMVFRTNGPDAGMKPEVRARLAKVANDGRRLTVLWFLTEDPRDCWDHFTTEGDLVGRGGRGELSLIAPFIPSKMGTNTYDDQLRAPAV